MTNQYKTRNKQAILDFLKEKENQSLTVKDIYSYLHNQGMNINITTIYRCLEKLSSDGIVMKYASDDGKSSYFKYINESKGCHEHFHLQCSECGKIIHLNCKCMDDIVSHIYNHHDFELKCDNSVLYGKCRECLEKNKNSKK